LILTIIGGLVLGTVVALVNTRISKKAMTSENNAMAMGVNAIRFALDISALVLAFLICKFAGLNMIAGLLSTAFGLTVIGIIFLIFMTKKTSKEMAEKNAVAMEANIQETSEETGTEE